MIARYQIVAGIDEVGRGCLAGPVVAAAVILPKDHGIEGIRDSKKTTLNQRIELDQQIRERAVAFAIGEATPEEIDRINILQASWLAMRRALAALTTKPFAVLVDGKDKIPDMPIAQHAIIGGDDRVVVIGAASIVAKLYRDNLMAEADRTWPGYALGEHKGYASEIHREAIARLGPTPLHRRSFRGVREHIREAR